VKSGSTFLLPCSYTISSFTDATGAPGILSCIPSSDIYNLTVSATTYCPGNTVTFALDNTTPGRTYQLYKDGNAVDALLSTGGGATFTGTFAGAGTYTAWVDDDGTHCAAQTTGVHVVSESPVPDAPTMGGDGTFCNSTNITATFGNGGSGIRWTDDNTTVSPRTVDASGTYYAVTTAAASCESIPAPVTVTIGMPPTSTGTCQSNESSHSGHTTTSCSAYCESAACGKVYWNWRYSMEGWCRCYWCN
jgi:hypothetical protein